MRKIALVMALLALGIAACGSEKLTDDEQLAVALANQGLAIADLDAVDHEACVEDYGNKCNLSGQIAADDLIAVYRAKPDAMYDNGDDPDLTMRQVVVDAANKLRQYKPELAAKLELALED